MSVQRLLHRYGIMTCCVSLLGCDSSTFTQARPAMPSHAIGISQTPIPSTLREMDEAERVATAQLFEALPGQYHQMVRETLNSTDWNTATSITRLPGPPEAAAHLSTVYSIREARRSRFALRGEQSAAMEREARVTIAAVPNLGRSIIVTRRPPPHLDNVVALNATEVNPRLIAYGLRAVELSRMRHGDFPSASVRMVLKAPPVGRPFDVAALDRGIRAAELLKKGKARQLLTYGEVRAVDLTVPPAAP
ncbi:MAG: hypothetical protein H0X64_00195 [Gemmatimonadaceae bacterium]|nr:hypothetical protein [Gemmatimonadaceae bacterium]